MRWHLPIFTFFLAAAVMILAGCPAPSPGTACANDRECPSGQVCRALRCAVGSDAAQDDGDATTRDVPAVDVPVMDTVDASASGQRCSAGRPCPAGYVCEEGACAIDCGVNARCGESRCCGTGEVCYLGACVAPGASCGGTPAGDGGACIAATRCPSGQQCDPSLGRCLPIPTATACEYMPGRTFEPELLWAWTGSSRAPGFGHVISTPAIADLDGDGSNDVIVPVADSIPGWPTNGGILCALSGAGNCGGGARELWCTSPSDARVNWVASVAVGDLDGTGQLTIVAGDARNDGSGGLVTGITGYTATGTRIPMLGTDTAGVPVDVRVAVGAPAIADLDADGHAEVIVGFTVFDSHGRLRWQRPGSPGNNNYGPITIVADLDGDEHPEVIGGNMAYHADGTEAWPAGVAARGLPDGWPAVADFDHDGRPEVVVVSQGHVRVFDRNGALYSTLGATVPGNGGPPTLADIDGDGTADIAVAGSNSLTTFRVLPAAGHALQQIWSVPSRDFSSNFTGSSVFDFDGDGRAEVIYSDECYARVYDGRGDGAGATTTRFQVPNTSCTGVEYPVVADVNGDGKAEFVVVSNDASGMGTACSPFAEQCRTAFPGYATTHGVRVYRDHNDNWVATRGIWNQHAAHVTNVCDGRDTVCPAAENGYGRIPTREHANWLFPAGTPLNSYRSNAQLSSALSAPDLVARDVRADLSGCPTQLGVRAAVTNIG
ncbi:MAG: FG-GAP-like repeat-containing protein, partial [Deltaproteobacteria bacterium]